MPLTGGAEKTASIHMEKALFRVEEAAAFLSVSRWTIYRWVEQGRLRGTKIGKGSLRIFRESIVGLIQNNENLMSDERASSQHSS